MQEKKDSFSWDILDTTTLMNPNEVLVYLIHKYVSSDKKQTGKTSDLKIILKYLKSAVKDGEKERCLKSQ